MFQLIIAIIAIALVAVLAVASLYYGGAAFSNGSAKAAAATVVSQAQQISAADVLYQNENGGAYAADAAALATATSSSEAYLASLPVLPGKIGDGSAWTLDSSTGVVSTGVANQEICEQINNQIGVANPTAATDVASLVTALTTANAQYGCGTVTGTPNTFIFAYR